MNRDVGIEKRLFFSALPSLHDCSAFRAKYTTERAIIGIQPPICRELIFTLPEILVSPTFDDNANLFIIAQIDVIPDRDVVLTHTRAFKLSYKSQASCEDFLQKLNLLKIKLCTRIEVDAEIFEYCFTYTLFQKLAPFWNKTSSFLVKGRNFLQDGDKIPALGLEIFVTDKICIALEPFLVKMPPVQVEDFSVDFKSLWTFKRDVNFIIAAHSIEDPMCFVLPSFRKCRVVSITHYIPDNTPFKTYNDLKQHWKLTYGYRVPQEDCHLYFNVRFPGSTVFTYPEWCIRRSEPIRFVRCDQDEICQLFLNDLQSRMPNVVASPLKFTSKSLYWQKILPTANEGNKSFLVKQPQNSCHNTKPFRFSQINTSSCSSNSKDQNKGFQFTTDKNYNEKVKSKMFKNVNMDKQEENRFPTLSQHASSSALSNAYKHFTQNNIHDHSHSSSRTQNECSQSVRPSAFSLKNKRALNRVNQNNQNIVYQNNNNVGNNSNNTNNRNNRNISRNIIDIPDSPALDQIVPDVFVDNVSTGYTNQEFHEKLENVQSLNLERNGTKKKQKSQSLSSEFNGSFVTEDENQEVPTFKLLDDKLFASPLQCPSNEISSADISRDTHTVPEIGISSTCSTAIRNADDIFGLFGQDSSNVQCVTQSSSNFGSSRQIDTSTGIDEVTSSTGKVIPQFGKRYNYNNKSIKPQQITTNNCSQSQQTSASMKFAPTFSSKRTLKRAHNHERRKSFKKLATCTRTIPKRQSNIEASTPKVPSMTIKVSKDSSSTTPSFSLSDISSLSTASFRSSTPSIRNENSRIKKTALMTPEKSVVQYQIQSPKNTTMTQKQAKYNVSLQQQQEAKSSQALNLAMEILSSKYSCTSNQVPTFSSSQTFEEAILSSTPDVTKQIKITPQQTPDSTATKKPRSKPKIQENIDVEEMARNRKLNKVNAVTLKEWLRRKEISFKASEKKEMLVEKVNSFLGVSVDDISLSITRLTNG